MNEFEYVRPTTLEEACAALAAPGARPLAGGTDLIVQLRERRREADRVVDLKHIKELAAITDLDGGGLSLGAAATATQLAADARISKRYPALLASLGMIGSRQVQNRASLGGNICNAAPSADAVPPLIGYGAQGLIVGPDGSRRLAIEDMFAGPGRTTLADGEVLIAIELPPPPERSAAHYIRFTPRREMDIAVAGVCSYLELADNNTVNSARIALASVAPTPIRSAAAEQILIGAPANADTFDAAADAAAADASPISDTRGSAEFRKQLVRALTARTLLAASIAVTPNET